MRYINIDIPVPKIVDYGLLLLTFPLIFLLPVVGAVKLKMLARREDSYEKRAMEERSRNCTSLKYCFSLWLQDWKAI